MHMQRGSNHNNKNLPNLHARQEFYMFIHMFNMFIIFMLMFNVFFLTFNMFMQNKTFQFKSSSEIRSNLVRTTTYKSPEITSATSTTTKPSPEISSPPPQILTIFLNSSQV